MNNNYGMITNIDTLKNYVSSSHTLPILVLKHSTSCPISANAHKEFNAYLNEVALSEEENGKFKPLLIRVIEERPVSLFLADLVGVEHQSPQILLIKDGQCVFTASHWKITKASLGAAVSNL